ncbi:MAG: hypothetical protein A2W93_06190 [Bacteroidetes bacterium GWF2_43_63]|nr:MAG: hypothetical protein A2W94_06780 [Bacteroidetes bacterium GWE2_42_42]OFY56206.1 MAG: hypothetical protein A2W93_06190 [Bacteroidetes bacterium GWF2_43_63]HBG70571.1 hypothetical protein [Bacteroidales bacterium]HCB61994.1 hypothetical protein [Bacteroidales bacterium]HCY22749.1 hypothetical protein [Bacteroidales bacterium]
MKYFTLLFLLISAVAAGQNELSLNNNPVGGLNNANPIDVQTNQINDVNIQVVNTDANPVGGNLINQQAQINYDININNTGNDIQQKSEGGIQLQVGSRSRSTSSPSASYSSSGSGKKKHSFVKDISKSIKAFNYKHSGKKKFRRHSGKHSRGNILRCFN